MGCHLKVDENDGYSVTGNTCPRGAEYGYEEATAPKRMVTSTVRIFIHAEKTGTGNDSGEICSSEEATTCSRDVSDLLPLVSYFNRGSEKIEARLPVKTSAPIPKANIMDVMKAINAVTVYAPFHSGDIIVPDVAGTGADLVATRSMESL
jgi:CxxC motif-containing protein